MRRKPIFTKIIIIIGVALICLIATFLIAFLLGSSETDFFDFSNLNLSNMVPIIIIGGFISCAIIGILVMFLTKDIFVKIKDSFLEENNGGNEK